MGEPATRTPAERVETRKLAAEIVESVRADAKMPLPLVEPSHLMFSRSDVEELVFQLADEVTRLQNELEIERRCMETWRATARQDTY